MEKGIGFNLYPSRLWYNMETCSTEQKYEERLWNYEIPIAIELYLILIIEKKSKVLIAVKC